MVHTAKASNHVLDDFVDIVLPNQPFEVSVKTIDISRLPLKRYTLTLNDTPIHLTLSELKCLAYLARAYSAKETARILNVSPRTVEGHLAQVKLKLDCSNKSELRDIFFSSNLSILFPNLTEMPPNVHIQDNDE